MGRRHWKAPLEPITRDPERKPFVTFDCEWWPADASIDRGRWLELRVISVYQAPEDGGRRAHAGQRWYRSVDDFLASELTRDNRGKTFYAHAGGRFDFAFLLAPLKSHGFHVECRFSGSACVHMSVWPEGAATDDDPSWTFGDSYFLLRKPLAKIMEAVGMEKGSKESIFETDERKLRHYCMNDAVGLYVGLSRLQEAILELGGEMRGTIAATAMWLFRRMYLKRTIHPKKTINRIARLAYASSRVEAIRPRCDEADYFDINSSFPASMKKPQPADFLFADQKWSPGELAIVRARVRVPEDTYLPPLPYRRQRVDALGLRDVRASANDGRLFFATGEWEAWFDSADLELLLGTGGRIVRVLDVLHFEGFTDLGQYVEDLYKKKADGSNTELERETYKILLNGLYGKFSEHSSKEQILLNPSGAQIAELVGEGASPMEVLPGIFRVERVMHVQHEHVPIGVHITALSRSLLHDYLSRAREVYYTDTDSVIVSRADRGAYDDVTSWTELGLLKPEYDIREGRFFASKMYAIRAVDVGKPDAGEQRKVKAKGFSGLTWDDFMGLAEYRDHQFHRMSSLKEMISLAARGHTDDVRGLVDRAVRDNMGPGEFVESLEHLRAAARTALRPVELDFEKGLSPLTMSKRCIDHAANDSRPWTVREIEQWQPSDDAKALAKDLDRARAARKAIRLAAGSST